MRMLGTALLAATLLLGACGDEAEVERETGGAAEAEGEVLGGTISDDMLPLESVRSQSPPLRDPSSNGNASSGPGDAGDSNGDDQPSSDQPADEPAPEPAAEQASEAEAAD